MNDVITEQNSLMEEIVRNYGSLIRAAVRKATVGIAYTDDIISEVYFAVLLTLRKLGTGWTPSRSFLYSVVRNKVNDFLRQKYREKNRLEEIKKHQEEQASQKEEVASKIHCLTFSEFRVFRSLGLGMTNAEIAQSLHVTMHTVKSHLKKIHAKCGVRDRAKLTLIAHQVCFQEGPECPPGEAAFQEQPSARPQSDQGQEESSCLELWGPVPSWLPMVVEASN
jgi:RNA polymerase sigma factor (sigma-70 family)